jgi:long-chain alkane monooxygenase
MNCVGHQSPGLWAHPRDRLWQYKDLEYWTELGVKLERGIFDGIFIADVIGYYDVYKGSNYHALHQAAQIPVNDPLQLVAPIAMATKHLGIGITASTSFEHPYTFARRLSTADHHTKGRVGWNIVTSYLESGAKNIGQGGLRRHDNRYEVAEEYVEVLYKLFEGSWEEGAIVRDREKRIFTNPDKVHEIGHKRKYFEVPGITCVSRRRNARRCSTRPAHRDRENRLPPGMRSASSLPRPPRRCSEATLPKCVARRRSRAATRASSTPIIFAR